MNRKLPQSGDIWSMVPHGRLVEQPSPLLLLESGEGDRWVGLPLFGNGRLFTNRDIELSPDPEFLLGERWCAAHDSVEVQVQSLWQIVDRLPRDLFQHILQFKRGTRVPLLSGTPIVASLGDPRAAFRKAWLGGLQEWVNVPMMVRLRVWLDAQKDLWCESGCYEELKHLQGRVMQGQAVELAVRGAERTTTRRFTSKVGAYQIGILVGPFGSGWRIALEVEADSVVLVSENPQVPLERLGGVWTLPGAPAIPASILRFQVTGHRGTEMLEVNLGKNPTEKGAST